MPKTEGERGSSGAGAASFDAQHTAPTASRFRKKPVVVDAWQMTDQAATPDWISAAIKAGQIFVSDTEVLIPTLEGEMRVSDGDWIICGVAGEFYPCKPDIFAATYEAVADVAAEEQGGAVIGVANTSNPA
jgi:hypothetical protein